jgi:hypothetical protein
MKSLKGLLRCLLNDVKRLHPEVKGLDRDLHTIEARFENEGVGFLSAALPALGKQLDRSLDEGRMTTTPGFAKRGAIPVLFQGMFCHIFDTKTGLLKSCDISLIKSLRQILYFFKKLEPDGHQAEQLDKSTKLEFFDVDRQCIEAMPQRIGFLRHVFQYMLPNLDQFDFLKGKHGPGAVCEKVSSNQKWNELARGLLDFDPRLLSIGYDFAVSQQFDQPLDTSLTNDLPSLSARLVTVPKSFTKLRTITVEPCLNQFVQQALGSHLRRHIEDDSILSLSLALKSQERNQELALEGSLTGDWCTIDLSSASDLLSLRLVESVFSCRPRFLEAILKCRTPIVSTHFCEQTIKKYAGMGNATTFPIQSVIFALLAICGSVSSRRLPRYRDVVAAARCVRVYGDDIIVRREHYASVADWITSFGLKINHSKTFSEGNFRESCGWDCYMGQKVTPIYLHHDPECTSKEPSAYASNVSTSNQLWLECYYETSNYLREKVDKGFPLPLVSRSSQALGWHTRQDVSSYQRWSRTLHRFENRSYVPIPVRRKDVLDGWPALLKFFHLPQLAELDPEHLESSSHKFNLKLKRRWVQ